MSAISSISTAVPAAAEPVAIDVASRRLLNTAVQVARSSATVLLTGESGTGKEVMARFIHHRSPRAAGPFVAVNCAAIPDSLIEATLFGFERGAFTGAARTQPGKFECADGGTLLLDEIAELPLELQPKLLRVLQEREVERIGARSSLALDVRVIAATNRDLRVCMAQGRFREDLFFRLNVFPIELLPLRSRPADILPLAHELLAQLAALEGCVAPAFAPAAVERLLAYNWPGNARELANALRRALIVCEGGRIEAQHLGIDGGAYTAATPPAPLDMKSLERLHILETLAAVNGSRKRAVERLGISERTLRHRLRQYRMDTIN